MQKINDEENSSSPFQLLKQTFVDLDDELIELENDVLDNRNQFKELKRKREMKSQKEKETFERENTQAENNYDVVVKEEPTQLQSELQQQTAANSQLTKQTATLEAELRSAHLKLVEKDARYIKLQIDNMQLSSEVDEKQAKIDKLLAYINTLEAGEDHFQTQITALEEAIDKLKADIVERELHKLDAGMAEQEKQFNGMEQQQPLNLTKKLSAERTELAMQFGAFKVVTEKNLVEIDNMLHRKQVDLTVSFKSMQFTIMQMRTRMSYMNNLFKEAYGGTGGALQRELDNQSASSPFEDLVNRSSCSAASDGSAETSNASMFRPGGRIKRRRLTKRRSYFKNDLEVSTDSDDTN